MLPAKHIFKYNLKTNENVTTIAKSTILVISESQNLYLVRVVWNDTWQQKTMYALDTILAQVIPY